jgi:hypothetical protein
MKKHILMATTALAISLGAPVYAQDDFAGFTDGIIAMMQSQGAKVTYDQRNVGADGSVEFVGFSMVFPQDKGSITADWFKGTPSATTPGQVTFTLSPSATLTMNDPGTGAHVINISNAGLVVTLDGITSGKDAPVLNFSVRADDLKFESGNPDDTVLKALNIEFVNLSQSVSLTQANHLLSGATDLAALGMNYDFLTPDGGEMAANGHLDTLKIGFQFIASDNPQNLIDYLSGTTTAFVEISTGASSSSGKMDSPEAQIAYTGTSDGGVFSARAENGNVDITEDIGKSTYSVSEFNSGGMPLPPFDVAFDKIRMHLSSPTVDHGQPEAANIEFAIRNLEVSESIYAMFDPAQNITRSPVNIVANLSANLQPKLDWSNPGQAMMALDRGNPNDIADIKDITINEVLLTAGGAKVTAEGRATIDNSMGFPFPTGKVTITADGVQALVNGLVGMGVVPQDQAGMMMGMVMAFARPGEQADQFISDIRFSPQGITANGTPLPFK